MAQLRARRGRAARASPARRSRAWPTCPSWYAAPATTASAVSYTEHGQPRPLPPTSQLAAYRVVQEALTNVVKHAARPSAPASVTWHGTALRVSVADDGRGAAPVTPGNGLVGLGERVAAAGGIVEFATGPHGRFRVTAVFA